jgi:cyclohexyl-isocyanide hydratase
MDSATSTISIGMICFDGITQLDLTGPYEVFSRMPAVNTLLFAPHLKPVKCAQGLHILPDQSFSDLNENIDVLFIPGGPGINTFIQSRQHLEFIRKLGLSARWVTSVCTGSLVLASAGLLDGFKATTHWRSLQLLEKFDVEVTPQRIVIDRNRITASGVSAGIDFALLLVSMLAGEHTAKEIQLQIEYDPAPPFDHGHPSKADPAILQKIVNRTAPGQAKRAAIIENLLEGQKDGASTFGS